MELTASSIAPNGASPTRFALHTSPTPSFEIHACTDVTGFSFLGHLSEMLNDDITALIDSISIPVITGALRCADEFFLTAAAQRNRNHVGDKVRFAKNIPFSMEEVLFDPQTSGNDRYGNRVDKCCYIII